MNKMKLQNLLNCHTIGVHSFPISFEDGLYKRIFYADSNHLLWKPFEIAIHPHHVDIKITVFEGKLTNPIYEISEVGRVLNKYRWNSHLLNGNGGFEYLGKETLNCLSKIVYSAGETVTMKSCELHTVEVDMGEKCVWLIEESIPSCEYFPINYTRRDLSQWTPEGLYIEVDNAVRDQYISKYLPLPI